MKRKLILVFIGSIHGLTNITEMEHEIFNRACAHYKKKYRLEIYDFDIEDRSTVIGEFWTDYFSGNPIYIEGGLTDEQRTLLGLHG